MKKTIKTLALITATIGVATVVKRVQKQSYSAVDENGITTILADGSNATLMRQTADAITTQRLLKRKKEQPAGTGHSTIYFGTIKPKNAQKGDIWFYPEKSSEIQLDRESSENINFTIMTDLK